MREPVESILSKHLRRYSHRHRGKLPSRKSKKCDRSRGLVQSNQEKQDNSYPGRCCTYLHHPNPQVKDNRECQPITRCDLVTAYTLLNDSMNGKQGKLNVPREVKFFSAPTETADSQSMSGWMLCICAIISYGSSVEINLIMGEKQVPGLCHSRRLRSHQEYH